MTPVGDNPGDRGRMHPKLPSSQVDQLGFLVADLGAAVETWSAAMNVHDWRVYTYSPQTAGASFCYRGGTGEFAMRLALANSVPQIELIQPLRGPSIYHEWIEHHGYGLHHVGFFVPSLDHATDTFRDSGLHPCQTGRGYGADGDGGFAYYEMEPELGTVIELIEVPVRRRPSEVI